MSSRTDLRRSDAVLSLVAIAPGAALLILLAAVPTIAVFVVAFQRVQIGDVVGPWVGVTNFIWALTSSEFYGALWRTFIWVVGSVALEMVLGTAIALLLNMPLRLRGLGRAIVLAPYLIPTVVAVLVWRYMFHDTVGIINYLLQLTGIIQKPLIWLADRNLVMPTVIIVAVWKYLPFVVIAILGILQAIPKEQYEAAKIDGASSWQTFWRITLPHIMPVFLLTALLRVIWTFNKFDIVYLLTGGGPMGQTTTLPLLIYRKAFADFSVSQAAAVAILAFLVLGIFLVIYFILMRQAEKNQ